MPFRFKSTDDTVEAGFQRIACAQIDEVLELVRARALPPERIVHQIRRSCKAMRGLFRLVEEEFPAYRTENATFRDLSRALSGSRDRKVIQEMLDRLAGKRTRALPAYAALQAELLGHADADASIGATLDDCREKLLAARVRAASWPLTATGWKAVGPGLRKTYRNARSAMRQAVQTGDVHLSHEWRKMVKYHWQQMRLMRQVAPEHTRERIRLIARLGDLLGDRHDLDLLVGRLRHAKSQPVLASRLIAKSHRRASKLDEDARLLGEQLFALPPGEFASAWQARWREWSRRRG